MFVRSFAAALSGILLMASSQVFALDITEHDLASQDGSRWLALRPSGSNSRGLAFHFSKIDGGWRVYDGEYELLRQSGMRILRMTFSDCWTRKKDDPRWVWDGHYSRNRERVELEYQTRGIQVVLTFVTGFDLDEKGTPREKRYFSSEHFSKGEIVSFKPERIPVSATIYSPPRFVHRDRWKARHVTEPTMVYGLDTFTGSDLYGWADDEYRDYYVFSLQGDTTGKAWCVYFHDDENGLEVSAGRGTYRCTSEKTDINVEMSFPRIYDGTINGTSIEWAVADTREKKGVYLTIPLWDRAFQFSERVPTTVREFYYTDDQGVRRRKVEGGGFLGLVPEERKPRSLAELGFFRDRSISLSSNFRFKGDGEDREFKYLKLLKNSPPPFSHFREPKLTSDIPRIQPRHSFLAQFGTPRRTNAEPIEVKSLKPTSPLAETGLRNMRKKKYKRAAAAFELALREKPRDLFCLYWRASCLDFLGEADRAKNAFLKVLTVEPNLSAAKNNLAWMMSTDMRPSVRNPELAKKYALEACAETEWKHAGYLDTLAATQASLGDFPSAVATQKKAIALNEVPSYEPGMKERSKTYSDGYVYRRPITREWTLKNGASAFGELFTLRKDGLSFLTSNDNNPIVFRKNLSDEDNAFLDSVDEELDDSVLFGQRWARVGE